MPEMTILSPSEQVAEHLRGELLSRRWKGTMPGVPALAAELGVDHKAVASGMRLLEQEGLLISQGLGRPRRIERPKNHAPPEVRVALLVFNSTGRAGELISELLHLLEQAGHVPFFADKSLQDLGMDARRVARFVRRTEADAWVVVSGSKEVLEWFAKQDTPAFALVGNRAGLPLAGVGPDKTPALGKATRRLIALGHHRISVLCRHQLRLPEPAETLRGFLDEIEAAGITAGPFHLPNWEESGDGFERVLDSLFKITPPTALILDEPYLYYAAYHYLAGRGLRVPQDVSLVCTDGDWGFLWCKPSVAHMRWEHRPVVLRVVRWVNNVARGKDDLRQSLTKAEFVEGGTVGPAPES
jgi:DNA-binding LacI/PurR family transcriptional regulator